MRPPNQLLLPLKFALVGPLVWIWRAARRLPLWILRPRAHPLRRAKSETWKRVSASVVAARLRAIGGVDARHLLCECRQPVLYIASCRDGIVLRRNIHEIKYLRPSVEVVYIDGQHQAMYSNPAPAAQAIAKFIAEVNGLDISRRRISRLHGLLREGRP